MPVLRRGLAAGGIAALLSMFLWWSGALTSFEYRTWDWRARLLAASPDSEEVVLILIDEHSIEWMLETNGLSWPWPRETYALMANFFERAGAKALAFDLIFADPSTAGVHDDRAFAEAIDGHGDVVLAAFLGSGGSLNSWPGATDDSFASYHGEANANELEMLAVAHVGALFPVSELMSRCRLIGNVNILPDLDGVYRRGNLIATFDGRIVPTLGVAAFLVGAGGDVAIRASNGHLMFDDLKVPLDGKGRMLMRYPDLGDLSIYNAAEIIQSELLLLAGREPLVKPEVFSEAHVLVGASAAGLYDLRPTPVHARAAGVMVHAAMLDNLLNNRMMRELSAFSFVVLLLFLAVPAALMASFVTSPYRLALPYLLFLPLPAAASIGGYLAGFWVPLVPAFVGTSLGLVSASILGYAVEGRQKRFIKQAFEQYLSPMVIGELIESPDKLRLGGERRELTIFFSDLAGFTRISEGLSPEELTGLLNDYLSVMTDIILDEGGTVDKYEGDAIIAFWNAPLSQKDHAVRAVRAALRCQAALARLRPDFRRQVGHELFMRIGLNSGPAVVGNMGSHKRFDYTMIGDSVNLAARLEAANKELGTYTILSKNTADLLEDRLHIREVGRIAVIGRASSVRVYEPLEPNDFEKRKRDLEVFRSGLLAFYDGRLAEATEAFSEIAGEDTVAEMYLRRLEEWPCSSPEEWSGVLTMTSK